MARTSPITIGLGVLMAVVLATGVWVLTRPRHADQRVAVDEPAGPVAPATPAPAPATPRVWPAPRPPAPVPPPPPAPAPAITTIAPDDQSGAAPPPAIVPAIPGRRGLLVKNHNMRLAEADEEAFRALNMDEATRARVRAINETHRALTEGDANTSEARATVRERYEALRLLLGNEGAQKFDTEERAATRKLRGKYRFEWGQLGRAPEATGTPTPAPN